MSQAKVDQLQERMRSRDHISRILQASDERMAEATRVVTLFQKHGDYFDLPGAYEECLEAYNAWLTAVGEPND